MTGARQIGLMLALFGALVLTPDTLFMRWSGMSGFAMLGWRGLLMGTVLITLWPLTGKATRGALAELAKPAAIGVALFQALNSTLFCLGVALAPVAVVLLAVATVPVFAAVLGRIILGERTSAATWITMAAVLAGIAIAVFGESGMVPAGGSALLGALAGLGVAASIALTFVILRRARAVPIQPVMGLGALIAGGIGLAVAGTDEMLAGQVWAIAVAGLLILPVSFLCLTNATRHTSATNVSLLLLLETVLGPVWVWVGAGEAMTSAMILGGAIVVGSLALYILGEARRARAG
ncbi:MAG: DMT family transporter [Proteobacteria bacterium]|nr:DMT family transporter [Pseudomonadota bacterium]